MDLKTKYHLWNGAFSLLFIVLVYLLLAFTSSTGYLRTIDALEFIILGLATYRLTRLVVKDKVFGSVREFIAKRKDNSFFYTLNELQICIWCVSIWAGLFVVSLYYLIPQTYLLFLLLALSAVGSFMQVVSTKISSS